MFKPPGGAALRRVYPEVIMADTVQNVLFCKLKTKSILVKCFWYRGNMLISLGHSGVN